MNAILLILANFFILLLYHAVIHRKVIKPLQYTTEKLIEQLETLIGDVRYNNTELVRRTDILNANFSKTKSEHTMNIKQNKNDIIKLKSQIGKIKK